MLKSSTKHHNRPRGGYFDTRDTQVMKRKRASDSDVAEARKRTSRQSPPKKTILCPLLRTLQQYGLLETIISSLCPDDLLALAMSSKTIYNAIAPRPESLENLLGKLSCSGRGISIRNRCHKKSKFFFAYECAEFVECGSSKRTESRPCVSCKVTTCNECRIHCVYQSHFEKPSDEDELPNFSGFLLLSPSEVPILSPHHLVLDQQSFSSRWQNPSNCQAGPYHDQGFIDVPFDDDAFGPPEFVEDILNLDLGRHSLAVSVSSNVPHPSPVLRAFHQITEQRKRWFCDSCLPSHLAKRRESHQNTLCQCSLKKQFLDRWLCLRCYETEEASIRKTYPTHVEQCGCGKHPGSATCLWCSGVILKPAEEQRNHPERESDPSTPESSP